MPLTVLTNPRLRTLSALLAATDWPEREQRPLPRGVHPQATLLKKHVSVWRDHPTVAAMQSRLNADPDLAPLFARALNDDPELAAYLQAFAAAASLAAYWAEQDSPWAQAVSEVQRHVNRLDFDAYLGELFDAAPSELVVIPNLAYPTTHSFGVSVAARLYSIMPPRKAVGESQPWPFGDDREYVVRLAVHDFVQAQLNELLSRHPGLLPTGENSALLPSDFRAAFPTWEKQVVELFAYAAQIIFLNRLEDGAGDSFAIYERRTRQLTLLPGVVDEVTNYISGRQISQQHSEIESYLPYFAKHIDKLLSESL